MSLYVSDRLVCSFGWNSMCSSSEESIFFNATSGLRQLKTSERTTITKFACFLLTYIRCHINTIGSPDDEHRGARNM
jgi:hypothetical protein